MADGDGAPNLPKFTAVLSVMQVHFGSEGTAQGHFADGERRSRRSLSRVAGVAGPAEAAARTVIITKLIVYRSAKAVKVGWDGEARGTAGPGTGRQPSGGGSVSVSGRGRRITWRMLADRSVAIPGVAEESYRVHPVG